MTSVSLTPELVQRLITTQFPQWKQLPVRPVANGGWDNRTFRLGDTLVVRMPSAQQYAAQVEKEYQWLPVLAPVLPLEIPVPLVLGQPGEGYPWHWSVSWWIEGDTVAATHEKDMLTIAQDLAAFLQALQRIDTTYGPEPGYHSFYRGGLVRFYDYQVQEALDSLSNKLDTDKAREVWYEGCRTQWQKPPVWVHGDISAGNLLVKNGKLHAVIDFGQLVVGDPACDLIIAWTLFDKETREHFRKLLMLDEDTWARGRAWALWKALIVAAGFTRSNTVEEAQCWKTIARVLEDE